MKEHIQPQSPPSIDYQSLVFLAAGGSGIVYMIDEKRVLKEFYRDGFNVERRAFEGSERDIKGSERNFQQQT
ncbi:hypothetical protein BDV96DRAFT_675895 [Lophiotrema nucula]|uniref:Uncharacterized protein n=1 Tax=Lophiotrema nucula TaxID=690887 RepID=A0A6A5YFJ2_9PLEO|nr:hypothetical protein BDV96DRAFT_675895 [Lophiotrema nucula]